MAVFPPAVLTLLVPTARPANNEARLVSTITMPIFSLTAVVVLQVVFPLSTQIFVSNQVVLTFLTCGIA